MMKISTEVPVTNVMPHADAEERHKPSGFHRIGYSRTDAGQPARVLSEVRVLPRRIDASNWVAALIAGAALTCQFFVHDELGLALVALSPLLLIALRWRDSKSAFQAAALWLLSACAELLQPPTALSDTLAQPPHRLVALLVLGLIVLRLRNAYTRMQEIGRRDPLTGLLNRRGFEELAARELRRAARYRRPVSFALIDIDRFKAINDRFGHATGDRVLQLVAARLRELRASDFAVRLGGDEFGLLMPETDQEGAHLLLARLEQRVHEEARTQGWPVSISVGVADNQTATRPLDALIAEADRRMYFAKASHR